MKSKVAYLALAAVCFGWGVQAKAEHGFFNRAEVVRAAETLAEEVEHLDESLHDVNAPAHFINKVHHFEETVIEFIDEVRAGCTYQFALGEMNHIRQDVQAIRQEFNAHPHLLYNHKVATEWRMMRRAYRWLDHAMYMHHRGWNAERNAMIEEDIRALEEHAANRE